MQLELSDLEYVAVGNSTTKKDAQGNACKDMINYLVRSGKVNAADAPNMSAPANEAPPLMENFPPPAQGFGKLQILNTFDDKVYNYVNCIYFSQRI